MVYDLDDRWHYKFQGMESMVFASFNRSRVINTIGYRVQNQEFTFPCPCAQCIDVPSAPSRTSHPQAVHLSVSPPNLRVVSLKSWLVTEGFLVGGFSLPIWKMMEWKSVGMIPFPYTENNPFMIPPSTFLLDTVPYNAHMDHIINLRAKTPKRYWALLNSSHPNGLDQRPVAFCGAFCIPQIWECLRPVTSCNYKILCTWHPKFNTSNMGQESNKAHASWCKK